VILSLSHRFIFVLVPKTAGSSVTMALRPYALMPPRTLWRSFSRRLPIVEPPQKAHFRLHETALDIRRKLSPPVFESFERFAVVRNPFDHAVSHFRYMRQFRDRKVAERFERLSFRDYLAERTKKPSLRTPFFARLPDQSHFLIDQRGELLVDRVVKFERLDLEMTGLARDLGLKGFTLKRLNVTRDKPRKRSWQSYYDTATRDMVLAIYDRDFDTLGYPREIS